MISEDVLNNLLVISEVKNKILGFQFEEDSLCRIHDFQSDTLVGNIYCGYVKDVVKNINAAFVEIDDENKGFLSLKGIPFSVKQGDKILVQVLSDKVKTKDYLLTWKLNLPSEALVLAVGDTGINISKKIKDKDVRDELKSTLLKYQSEEYALVIRTNATIYTFEELQQQAKTLIDLYEEYKKKMIYAKPKTSIYSKNHLLDICKEFANNYNSKIITDVVHIYNNLTENQLNVSFNSDSKVSLKNKYSLEKHINNALSKHVWLKSGAYLIIEHTEAMTIIDVNTGKVDVHTNRQNTLYRVNKEAAKEISRQLKIRNISGTIIIDFINMDNNEFYDDLTVYMKECVSFDYTTCTVVDVTKLGLMEITRKKQEKPLAEIIK